VLEELAVLELVLDGIALIGAWLLYAVGRRNRVGVGMTPVLLLSFPLP
jgi:hypothetical protein